MRREGFTAAEIALVEKGGLVTRLLSERADNAAFVVGATRIEGPASLFVERVRELGSPASRPPAGRTLETGRFAAYPTVTDLEALHFDHQDLRALGRCEVGDCDLQVNRLTMESAGGIDWRAPGAEARANELLKSTLLEYTRSYLLAGSSALPVYDDGVHPEPVARGLARILESSPEIVERNPAFSDYVLRYPDAPRPADLEDFVFWSKERLSNPVVSLVHVFIQRLSDPAGQHQVALKHVYDSHYFLAYAEFWTVLPQPGNARGCYLVRSVRALINPPRGPLRGLLLGRIKRAMRNQLADDMARDRQVAERTGQPGTRP
jgi:hypothetical protein